MSTSSRRVPLISMTMNHISENQLAKPSEVPEVGEEVEIATSQTWQQKVWEVLGYNLLKPMYFRPRIGLVYLDLIEGREEAQWETCYWQLSKCAHVVVDMADFKGPDDFPVFPSISLAVTFLMNNPNFLQVIFLHKGLHDIVKEEIVVGGDTHILGCSDQIHADTVVLRGYEKPVLKFVPGSSFAHVANITFHSDKSSDVVVVEGMGAAPTFHNCVFRGNGKKNDLILRVENRAFPKFMNCKFHDAKIGLFVFEANIKCELCIFTDLRDGAKLMQNTVPWFKTCEISNCSNMGIRFEGKAHGCFEFNKFTDNGIAFYVKHSVRAVVERCEFKDNNHGILVDADAVAHFIKNSIVGCREFIVLAQHNCFAFFNENTITGCGTSGKGIHLMSGTMRFYKDKLEGAEIMIYSEANLDVAECDIFAKSLKQCIGVHAGTVIIRQNKFFGPGLYGVFMAPTVAMTMFRNIFHDGMVAVGVPSKKPALPE